MTKKLGSKSVDRRLARPEEASPHSITGAEPLITWTGKPAMDSLRSVCVETAIRLHFLIVDRLIGLGYVVAGWFADPALLVANVLVDGAMGGRFDLFSEALLLTEGQELQGFEAPRGTPVKFGFFLLLPERTFETTDGLHLRLHL